MTPTLRPKKCRCCKEPFTPTRPMQVVCGILCAKELAANIVSRMVAKRKKAERKADAEKRAKLKSRAQWLSEAQTAVNKYVRLRDAHLGCCSCDRPASWDGQWHASHFRSVGAASAVRFHLWNINKACSICNNHKSGNLSEYEPRLRALRGDEKVDWLRSQNQRAEYPIDYLKRLKGIFARKARRLEKRLEAMA